MSELNEIVRLLRTLIRLADSADDCVAANAICERIERDASQKGPGEVALLPDEEPIVLHLLRRLLVLADSYDLALEASVAIFILRSRS